MTDPMELDCQAAADRLHEFEQGFQRFMTLKMQGVGIPRNLRARIAQRLSQETSQAGDR